MNNELQELSKEADNVIDEYLLGEISKQWGIELNFEDPLYIQQIKKFRYDINIPTVTSVSMFEAFSIISFSNNKQIIIRTKFLTDCFTEGLDDFRMYTYEKVLKEYKEWKDKEKA